MSASTTAGYDLEGSVLEACNCEVVCPCGAGGDPDGEQCTSLYAYHIDHGQIRGVDVSGLTFLLVGLSEGKVLDGHLKEVFFVDQNATEEQREALLDAFEGNLGGPLADLAGLIEERLGVYQAPISYDFEEGHGRLSIEGRVTASVEGAGVAGADAKLAERGDRIQSPAWVSQTSAVSVSVPEHGLQWELADTNAVRSSFRFSA